MRDEACAVSLIAHFLFPQRRRGAGFCGAGVSPAPRKARDKMNSDPNLGDYMRSDQCHEFAGSNDFGLLPELWEMALVARHKIIGSGGIRALQENVVIWIPRNVHLALGQYHVRTILDASKELLPQAPADFELWARQDNPIFRKNGRRYIQPRRTCHR
jgi:hypothetical protein